MVEGSGYALNLSFEAGELRGGSRRWEVGEAGWPGVDADLAVREIGRLGGGLLCFGVRDDDDGGGDAEGECNRGER
jgi:hypothetical protein